MKSREEILKRIKDVQATKLTAIACGEKREIGRCNTIEQTLSWVMWDEAPEPLGGSLADGVVQTPPAGGGNELVSHD